MLLSSRVVRVVVAVALAAATLLLAPQAASADDHLDDRLGQICGAAEGDVYNDDGEVTGVVTHLMTYQDVAINEQYTDSDGQTQFRNVMKVVCAVNESRPVQPSSSLTSAFNLSTASTLKVQKQRCTEKLFHNRYAFDLDDVVAASIECVARAY